MERARSEGDEHEGGLGREEASTDRQSEEDGRSVDPHDDEERVLERMLLGESNKDDCAKARL